MIVAQPDRSPDRPPGSLLISTAAEKLALIKQLCRGFAEPEPREDHGYRLWRITTPAIPLCELIRSPVEGFGCEPDDAITDCWAQLIAAPFILSNGHGVPRTLAWDGIGFRDIA